DRNTSINDADPTNDIDEDDGEDEIEKFLPYAIIALGFGVGFWGFFFILVMQKEKLWVPYWRFVNSIAVRI
ncbi:hypothetical protein MKW92_042845, partial [Papaver armeniacum]